MDVPARLKELGLTLPAAPKPVAAYVPAVLAGDTLYVSGQLPMLLGKLLASGPVPSRVSLEEAQKAAGQCMLNALAIIGDAIDGDWHRLVRIVRLGVFVACDASFTDQAKVANGASELLGQILDHAGHHARVTVGVGSLPLGATVEVEVTAEIRQANRNAVHLAS
jgi:enamine deaminase RidA (YjgF/YER057c/UK114 family)